jgi:hypothetical protein
MSNFLKTLGFGIAMLFANNVETFGQDAIANIPAKKLFAKETMDTVSTTPRKNIVFSSLEEIGELKSTACCGMPIMICNDTIMFETAAKKIEALNKPLHVQQMNRAFDEMQEFPAGSLGKIDLVPDMNKPEQPSTMRVEESLSEAVKNGTAKKNIYNLAPWSRRSVN